MKFSTYFHHFFSLPYIFDFNFPVLERADRLYLALGLGGIIVGAAFWLISLIVTNPFAKKVWRRLAQPFIVIGILEGLWYALRSQSVRFFGSHFIAWLLILIGIVWLIPALQYLLTKYRKDTTQWRKDQVKYKYLKNKF